MKFRAVLAIAGLIVVTVLISSSVSFNKGGSRGTTRFRIPADFKTEAVPFDQPAEANEHFVLKRSPDGHSPIHFQRYFDAIERSNRMPLYSTANRTMVPAGFSIQSAIDPQALGAWTSLGPGNIGGRTRALLIHPNDPTVMYAAGVAGGVWKSTNSGGSWTPLADVLSNIAFCSLAFDTTNPEVIYAGTGEGFFASDNVRGAGIFKTTNGGASWTFLAGTATEDFHFVNDIVVSPNDHLRVYAATRTGVWRSADGGVTWSRSLHPLNAAETTINGGCLDLAIRTDQTSDYLFAACGTLTQSTVYRNINAGDPLNVTPWTAVLTDPMLGRTTLAIAPSNQNIIYGLASSIETGNYNLGLLAVFRSTASGDEGTWEARVRNTDPTKLNTVLLSNPVVAIQSSCNSGSAFVNQGWYDNTIAVDPVDSNRIWAGGIDLFRSDDGGASWGLASYWWAPKSDPHYAHADQHAIVFHPQYNGTSNRIMYVTNDGGIFRTDNARAATAKGAGAPCDTDNTQVVWTSLNNEYGVTQFFHGLPYPGGLRYVGGTQDNGTLRGTVGSGSNWSQVFGGDGGYVAVDPTGTDTVYVETTRLSLRKSDNGGQSFRDVSFGINESSSNFLFINPFMMDPSVPQRIWTGGKFLWRTDDAAATWTQGNSGVLGGSVSAIAIAESDSNYVLAGTGRRFAGDPGGFIHRTKIALTSNATTEWPSAQPRTGFVSWLTFDPNDVNIAYATYSTFGGTHVWKSTDAGATWAGLDGIGDTAIPDVPVHTIVVDPTDSQTLYVGTDIGVFVSLNGGATWARENTGFANTVVESLTIGSVGSNHNLFAFTHGRGAWRIPLGPASLKIRSASLVGKKLFVFGHGFQLGAKIMLNGAQQKTRNDETTAETNLIGKKAGKFIPAGQTVSLRIANPDGAVSPEFKFTRR
jgi:hypothetical protein